VSLKIDFKNREWHLGNIHHFDTYGNIALVGGRYGLCGDPAAYVYDRIKYLFGSDYTIELVHAAESGYFLDRHSPHYVLRITKDFSIRPEIYILDPSFRRCGSITEFDDYMFYESMGMLPHVARKDPNGRFDIGSGIPVVIRKNILITSVVDGTQGHFDEDSFMAALTYTYRHKYAGQFILAVRNVDGEKQIFENTASAHRLFREDEYARLRAKILRFFEYALAYKQTGIDSGPIEYKVVNISI